MRVKSLSTVSTVAVIALLAPSMASTSPLGPDTPSPHNSSKSMHVKMPSKAKAGDEIKGVASRFIAGEYVTLWSFKGRHSSQLNGDTATGRGSLTFYFQTAAGISKGEYKICAKGERSKRVACGVVKVRGSSSDNGGGDGGYTPPTTGPGYTPPTTGPGYIPPTSG